MKLLEGFHLGTGALLLLALLVILFLWRSHPLLARQSLIASSRALIQISLLGVALLWIFEHDSWFFNLIALLLMLLFASLEAKESGFSRRPRLILFLVLGGSSLIALPLGLLTQTLSGSSREFIPIAGMVVGNSLSAYLLCAKTLQEQLLGNLPLIEGKLALGDTLAHATQEERQRTMERAMLPLLNSLKNLGVIFIPGAMTGMLLAGFEPMQAASLQLSIMLLLFFGSLSACYITSHYLYKEVFYIPRFQG